MDNPPVVGLPPAWLRVAGVFSLLSACSVPPLGWPADGPSHSLEYFHQHGGLVGAVRSDQGVPIAGAFVISEPHGFEAVTDADGQYAFGHMLPDTYRMHATAPGWSGTTDRTARVVERGVAVLDITVLPVPVGGVLTVEVIDWWEVPLHGATVSAGGRSATTDEAGIAVLDGLEGWVDVRVEDGVGWPWEESVHVPGTGGTQVYVRRTGRPDASATFSGSASCEQCHERANATHAATTHATALTLGTTPELLAVFQQNPTLPLGSGRVELGAPGGVPTLSVVDALGVRVTQPVVGWLGRAVPWIELGDQAYPAPLALRQATATRPGYGDSEAALVPYQVDRWLDGAGVFAFAPSSRPDPARSADAECFLCHATGMAVTPRGDGGVDLVSADGVSAERWVEPGVGCEACHGAGSRHIEVPVPEKGAQTTRQDFLDSEHSDQVCGQCHGGHYSHGAGLPWPWSSTAGAYVPGADLYAYTDATPSLWASGAAAGPHMQLDELDARPHMPDERWSLRCVDCHEAHGATEGTDAAHRAQLLADPDDNSLCLMCHLDGDPAAAAAHDPHGNYDPDGPPEVGRCASCHMPETAAELGFSPLSGRGDKSSHWFGVHRPQHAVDEFIARSASSLPVGSFPIHGCADCHAYSDYRLTSAGGVFSAVTGDPTLQLTHQSFQTAFEGMFP